MGSRLLPVPVRYNILIAGAGRATNGFLSKASRLLKDKHVAIVGNGITWAHSMPRNQLLGQSRQGMTQFPNQAFYSPKERMPVHDYIRETEQKFAENIANINARVFECFESEIVSAVRIPNSGFQVLCRNGLTLFTDQLIFGGGLGPEMTFEDCGTLMLNEPSPKRGVLREIDTVIRSMERPDGTFRKKKSLVYGGGASAAWRVEQLILEGSDVTWLSKRGFEGASPNGVNDHVLYRAQKLMMNGWIDTLRYIGDPTTSSAEGVEASIVLPNGKKEKIRADNVICAAGADIYGPTGVRRVFGDECRNWKVGKGSSGVFAYSESRDLIVIGAAGLQDLAYLEAVNNHTLPQLALENRIPGGGETSSRSGEAAAEALIAKESSS